MTNVAGRQREPFTVSVVIPLYNKAPFIRATLHSVLGQTHPAEEIIIVDDGSTDSGPEDINDLLGDRIRLVRQDNAGPGPARNRGIAEANYPWVAFIDADDLWRSNHLQTVADLNAAFPDADALSTSFERVDARDSLRAAAQTDTAGAGSLIDYFDLDPTARMMWTSCVAVRRFACQSVGSFAPFVPGEDADLWVRLALDHPIAASQRTTAIYTQRTGGIMDAVDRWKNVGFRLHPIFATLDRALGEPRYTDQHASMRRYRARLLKTNIRQALYRGEAAAARAYIAELDRNGRTSLGVMRPLSFLPGALLRGIMLARSRILHSRPPQSEVA
ncbi:MAG: glycosyltransferase family 2 protein [Sphingomicrobium sp.]|nr:glycosyltransferase family 2 protein [Sphingomonadales bacterium]